MALPLDKRILGYIRTHPRCQRNSVQRAFGINKNEINQILYSLEAKKLIERTSSNPPLWSCSNNLLQTSLNSLNSSTINSSLTKKDYKNDKIDSFYNNNSSIQDHPYDYRLTKSTSPTHKVNYNSSLSSINRVNSTNDICYSVDLLQPVSLLHFIAAKFSLYLKFEEHKIDCLDWQVEAILSDPVNTERGIKELGDIFQSLDVARYSASVKLLKVISKLNLPFSSIALNFIDDINKEQTPKSLSTSNDNNNVPNVDLMNSQQISISPPYNNKSPLSCEKGNLNFQFSNNNTSPSLNTHYSNIFSPFNIQDVQSIPYELNIPEQQYNNKSSSILDSTTSSIEIINDKIRSIGETYGGEEGPYLEFKGSKNLFYEYPVFKHVFKQIVWDYISSFINLHANGNNTSIQPKIVFGISDNGIIQGIKINIPKGMTKQDLLRKKQDEFSRKIVDIAKSIVQPKEITSHVRVNFEEVLIPNDKNLSNIYGNSNEYLYAIVEVIIAIPNYPTLCSVRDIFYYHQPNAASISKMTIQQLYSRFTCNGFKIVST